MRSKFAAGVAGLVAFCVGVASCVDPVPPECPEVPPAKQARQRIENFERRPQTAHLRGHKLDQSSYLYFYGSAEEGRIIPTKADGTPSPGKLIAGGASGNPTGADLTYHEDEVKEDPCVRLGQGGAYAKIAAVPTYVLWQGDDLVCGYDGDGERENQYDPAPADLDRCGGSDNHRSMTYRAIAVPGYWDGKGHYEALGPGGKKVFTMGCIHSAIAKCVHWGYVPWAKDRDLKDHHQACVHAAMANYKEQGPRTCGHTVVDFFDNIGIQGVDWHSKPAEFEAAWGPKGAVCVAQTRYSGCQSEPGLPLKPSCDELCAPGKSWEKGVFLCTRAKKDQNLKSPDGKPCPGIVEPHAACR